jgi:1-acyl-sn-glycerol-3-phosphate acyltransferase
MRAMRSVVSAIRLSVGFVLVAVLGLLAMVIALPLLPWRMARIQLCNVYGKIVGRAVCFLAGARPRVSHRERLDGSMPAIYVANHTSTLDAFLSTWLCPMGGCGVFKREITRIPVYGWLLLLSGHLTLDRSNSGKAVDSLRRTAEFMKGRRVGVWIMPEGTRSRDGRLLPFKKGFVHLAIATGLPVVPVVFHGAHKNWEKHTFQFVPMDLDVDVLDPISTQGWTEERAAEHAAAVHDVFAAALRDDQKPAAT